MVIVHMISQLEVCSVAGAFLCAAARDLLKIPMFRYVDDFFSGERKESAKEAMKCFARQTFLLLCVVALRYSLTIVC